MATRDAGDAPTLAELTARAEALLPRLRERAEQCETLRRVPDETIADFQAAGFFRVFQPARYGGYELDYGHTQVELGAQLGRACGSSAWVQSVVACHAWLLGMFPLAAQDAVWAHEPEALLSTGISARAAQARPVAGGYVLDGHWEFSSGVDAVQWVMVAAPVERDGGPPEPRFFIVPRPTCEVVDNWFAAGLRGTGSKDVVVRATFVPEEHSLSIEAMNTGRTPGGATNGSYIYRLPLTAVFPYNIACPALGIARGAIEEFVGHSRARAERVDPAARALRIAEASAAVDAAEALLRADALEIKRLGEAGAPIPLETRARWMRDLAYAARLCLAAVDCVATAAGAHSIYEPSPLHRAARDVRALLNHVGVSWDVQGVNYGRVRLGLEPTNPLLRVVHAPAG